MAGSNDADPAADWSDESPAIKEALDSLGLRSIPAVAIYGASSDEPIVLRDAEITEERVLAALEAAYKRAD